MILTVKATPNAKFSAIKRYTNGILYVAVAAPPEEGKANTELLRFLKIVLGVAPKLLTGSTSHTKRIGINLNKKALGEKIAAAMGK
jgi:uncharacterized protein (TIGR00251 family)